MEDETRGSVTNDNDTLMEDETQDSGLESGSCSEQAQEIETATATLPIGLNLESNTSKKREPCFSGKL